MTPHPAKRSTCSTFLVFIWTFLRSISFVASVLPRVINLMTLHQPIKSLCPNTYSIRNTGFGTCKPNPSPMLRLSHWYAWLKQTKPLGMIHSCSTDFLHYHDNYRCQTFLHQAPLMPQHIARRLTLHRKLSPLKLPMLVMKYVPWTDPSLKCCNWHRQVSNLVQRIGRPIGGLASQLHLIISSRWYHNIIQTLNTKDSLQTGYPLVTMTRSQNTHKS